MARRGSSRDTAPPVRLDPQTAELVDRADLEALIGRVRSLAHDGRWDSLLALRDAATASAERGRQLWPAAAYAEYRLALEGPAGLAVGSLDSSLARFALGPFSEVAAQHHPWIDVREAIGTQSIPAQGSFVQERVLRGEDLRADPVAVASSDVYGLPLALQPWEPAYPLAAYEPDRATFPSPALEIGGAPAPLRRADPVRDPAVVGAADALLDLVRAWSDGSNGRSEAVGVEGTATEAIGALGLRAARVSAITGRDAIALMAWGAANGGAHGRRPGMAMGRSRAWWAAAQLLGIDDDPIDPDELGAALDQLRWFVWDDGAPDTGWALRLAIEDPDEELAWVLAAVDAP